MPLRPPAGFIRPGYDPLKVPNAPTIGTATGGDASASVSFTAPSNVGGSAITQYTAVSTPGGLFAQGSASPLTVTGLTNGTPYTFTVWALNTYGPSPYSAASGRVTPVANPNLGLFGGGNNGSTTSAITYISIATTGNSTSFGNLTSAKESICACASTIRGVFTGGSPSSVIEYVTFSTTGNATDFGDLTTPLSGASGCNSSTRGLFGGGTYVGNFLNTIGYITIATTGNAISFGQLTQARSTLTSCSSPTRGLFAAGEGSGLYNVIDYVTIATTGNATDFGDIAFTNSSPSGTSSLASCASSTRGVFAGGNTGGGLNIIQYVTISTTGNSLDFGDLTFAGYLLGGCSSPTRGVFGGGYTPLRNTLNYITISTTGNAVYFGDLSSATAYMGACSSNNGGVQ